MKNIWMALLVVLILYMFVPQTVLGEEAGRVSGTRGGGNELDTAPSKVMAPGIVPLYPQAGDELVVGEEYDIRWDEDGSITNVKIEYSVDGNDPWIIVTASTPASNKSFTWKVPDVTPLETYVLRFKNAATDEVNDDSPQFSILAAGSQALNIETPVSGVAVTGGVAQTVSWYASAALTGSATNIIAEYKLQGNVDWVYIGTALASAGSLPWNQFPDGNFPNCRIRITSSASGNKSKVALFPITPSGNDYITLLTPNGGQTYFVGNTYTILWQSSTATVGNVQIQYSIDNGASWSTVVASTANDASYEWTIPNSPSWQCLIRIREASDLNPSDTSKSVFAISDFGDNLSITSPVNGDIWQVGTEHDITWVSGTSVGSNVKLEYSTDKKTTWTTIASSTANDGKYTWTVPDTPSTTCNVRISDAADGNPTNTSAGSFTIVSGSITPVFSINHDALYFAWVKSDTAWTGDQIIRVNNSGGGVLHWRAEAMGYSLPADWLKINNTTGVQSGRVIVTVNPVGLDVGSYTGRVVFTDFDSYNEPQTVWVYLQVYAAGSDTDPFGTFETPQNNATVRSSIPVTGWALDNVGVDKVTIFRDPVAGEGKSQVYIGDAILVEGVRPDVEQNYPTYPMSYQAGWGYMMLTNFLPNGGNGTFTLHAYVEDVNGNEVYLGSKTIYCDNAHAVKPFGAIDTPAQGGTASGTDYRNQGWVLTPQPNQIPVNGSTISVYIDGQKIGTTHYNVHRPDIATLFPGYANSNGALAYYNFDTTEYESGVHTIQWVARDNAGNSDGIGSRYFAIQNSGYNRETSGTAAQAGGISFGNAWHKAEALSGIPQDETGPVEVSTGTNGNRKPTAVFPAEDGVIHISIPQDQLLVVDLKLPTAQAHYAYMEVGEALRLLPPGASLDRAKGILYWLPGPAAFGKYSLVLVSQDNTGNCIKKRIQVDITPKYPVTNE